MTDQSVISTADLTKQFDVTAAVQQVNLHVQRGEIYGLIGPNGAGKTTLIRMLASAEEPTEGSISIEGAPLLKGQANLDIKRKLGFLPDDFPLYGDLSVWNYLDYFARLYYLQEPALSDRITAVLALVDLANKQQSLVSELSRGMKQRLSLARTIIHRPTVLLLDEPVSGLDPIARVHFRDTLKGLQKEGMTILISSHILSDLEDFCTSIGIMEQGRLVESSSLPDLYRRGDLRRVLISTLGDTTALMAQVQDCDGVESAQAIPNRPQVCVQFSGSDEGLAELLRSLVLADIPITEFSPVQDSLEDIFLKLGYERTA
ncbi:MAG: ABC transporter ATP-binding protein [Thermosynechococcaceae cyanobacterium]